MLGSLNARDDDSLVSLLLGASKLGPQKLLGSNQKWCPCETPAGLLPMSLTWGADGLSGQVRSPVVVVL